jgi:hypothetical protein
MIHPDMDMYRDALPAVGAAPGVDVGDVAH